MIVNSKAGERPDLFERAVRALPWRPGQAYAWSATEFEVMWRMRRYLREDRGLGLGQLYISSYWKQGMDEARHREIKSANAKAVPAVQSA